MIKNPKRLSRQKKNLLVGLSLLLIIILGSIIGFLMYAIYGRQTSRGAVTLALTSTETWRPLSGALPQTVASTEIPFSSSIATTTSTATQPAVAATPTTIIYIVQGKDTLWGIALQFGTTVAAIQQANGLTSDTIYPDQKLIIPSGEPPTPVVAGDVYMVEPQDTVDSIATQHGFSADDLRAANAMYGDALLPGQKIILPKTIPVPARLFQFSINQGDLASAYPLSLRTGRFALHYTPNTFPAQDPQSVYDLVSRSVDHIERLFQVQLTGAFDVYAAGSVFNHPESQLRGISFSTNHRSFFLDDGTGSAVDQQYISAHELTHLFLWNTLGQPASTLLSEGAAVYSGMELIGGTDYLPLKSFCAAYWQVGNLPLVSGELSFTGHIYDLENYYASGCFVAYLVERYGVPSFGQLYHSGDFIAVFGKTLPALEQEWIASLKSVQLPPDLEAARLVKSVNILETDYRNFMPVFSGTPAQLRAYYHLDLARLALLKGHFDDMQTELANFQSAPAGP